MARFSLFHPHEILVLLFQLTLDIFEGLFDLPLNFFLRCLFKLFLGEKFPIHVPYKFKHLSLCKRRNLMAIKTMTIKDSNYFNVSIKDDENVVLVLVVCPTFFAHELDLLVDKFGLVLPRKMTIHV